MKLELIDIKDYFTLSAKEYAEHQAKLTVRQIVAEFDKVEKEALDQAAHEHRTRQGNLYCVKAVRSFIEELRRLQ